MSAPKSPQPAQKMGMQPALTLCPAPNLDWSRKGTPASDTFDDIYFSVEGGLEETRAVYLAACGLPERWTEPAFEARPFVIGELGFGTGLNFLAALQLWKVTRRPGQRLHFVSIEKFPFAKDDLARALESWPELKVEARSLLSVWPGRVRGTHVMHLPEGVTLTLCHDEAQAALAGLSMKADAWFLDGFSPAKNPAMWSEAVMGHVGRLSAGEARIGTFTAAGFVREGLAKAGFEVRKVEGFGRKRHRIEAVMPINDGGETCAEIRPVIVGAGIAGASLARAFARRGIKATVIDAGDDTAASGNAAAIIKPRLDRQDSPLARFALSSYLYALNAYMAAEAILTEGVIHAPQSPEQIARQEALCAKPPLPAEHMVWRDGAVFFPKAQVIDPASARAAFLARTDIIKGVVNAFRKTGDIIELISRDGDVVASGTHVVFAAGAGARELKMFADLELRYSRGQISWAEKNERDTALTYGGYAVPLGDKMLLGATHARLTDADPYIPIAEDDAANLEGYEKAAGESATLANRASRASVRVNSKTTWPFITQIDENVFALTGLGSRGFVFAPLMAEMLAADMMDEPVAWPLKLKQGL